MVAALSEMKARDLRELVERWIPVVVPTQRPMIIPMIPIIPKQQTLRPLKNHPPSVHLTRISGAFASTLLESPQFSLDSGLNTLSP